VKRRLNRTRQSRKSFFEISFSFLVVSSYFLFVKDRELIKNGLHGLKNGNRTLPEFQRSSR
jgi:hypothetical protein